MFQNLCMWENNLKYQMYWFIMLISHDFDQFSFYSMKFENKFLFYLFWFQWYPNCVYSSNNEVCEKLWSPCAYFTFHLISYCRTDIDEAKVISVLGVRTDMILESSYGNMSAHKKFKLKAKIKLVVSCQSLYASPEDGDA